MEGEYYLITELGYHYIQLSMDDTTIIYRKVDRVDASRMSWREANIARQYLKVCEDVHTLVYNRNDCYMWPA